MNKKCRILLRSVVSLLLVTVISFNTIIYSFASGTDTVFSVIAPNSNAVQTPYGTLEITEDAIIIDGHSYSKEQFQEALAHIELIPQSNDTQQNSQIKVQPRSAVGALAFVGEGLSGVFWQIAFILAMSLLAAVTINKLFSLPSGSLPGLGRPITFEVKDSESIFIDGIRIGANWVTQTIADYIPDHIDEIQVSETAIIAGLGDIAGKYAFSDIGIEGYGKCEQAAQEMISYLKKNNQHGALITLTWLPRNKSGYIWSEYAHKSIGDNGLHAGVLYKDKTYCNVHPYGLPKQQWINDFSCEPPAVKQPAIETPF